MLNRRSFLATSTAVAASSLLPRSVRAAHEVPSRIYKTLKLNMVRAGNTLTDKFKIAKAAGFAGIEVDFPELKTEDVLAARDASGLFVDGSVCSTHWNVRHTDPDPAVRRQALEDLMTAIRQTHEVGGHTVLLVNGHGKDGQSEELIERSFENIKHAIPLAAELGIPICLENVWNHFLYNHEGGNSQDASAFAAYVDRFDSPWFGMQFDIGNHWKFGNPGEWIRQLDKRIIKLDIKDFSRAEDTFVPIGEGDLPWADVRAALHDIGYNGWCAAEVTGGDQERLSEISEAIDRVLELDDA